MTTKELFGVGVRLIGLLFVMLGLPTVWLLDLNAATQVVSGLILITQADLIVGLCYRTNPRASLDVRDHGRDFRDT